MKIKMEKIINGHKIHRLHDQVVVTTSWGYTTPFSFIDEEDAIDFCRKPESKIREQIKEEIAFLADAHSCYSNAEYSSDGPAGAGRYCVVCGALVSKALDY